MNQLTTSVDTMNEPKMNVELLLKVHDHIVNIKERGGDFDMYSTFDFFPSIARANKRGKGTAETNWCGTIACIAGWALALDQPLDSEQICHLDNIPWWKMMEEAARVLRITEGQAMKLFHVGGWPESFIEMVGRIGSEKTAPFVIDDFIATKGWPDLTGDTQ